MRLGEYVKQYREQHDLSMRDFAKMADLSHQYVACLEKGVNNNGQPLSPTMTTYSKVAKAVGQSESVLMALLVDDVRVNPDEPDESGYQEEDELVEELQMLRDLPERRALLHATKGLTADQVRQMADFLEGMKRQSGYDS